MNLTRWATLNPGWEVELLDAEDADAVLADVDTTGSEPNVQALADLVRIRLLRDHGGIWVDATLYPCWPLDRWLPGHLGAGFFLFKNEDDPQAVANWFLASEPHHPIVEAWWEDAARYWSRPRTSLGYQQPWPDDGQPSLADPDSPSRYAPYFWSMDLWRRRLDIDPGFAAVVQRIPFAEERLAGLLNAYQFNDALTPEVLGELLESTPVQKLDWRGWGWPFDRLAGYGIP